MAGLGQYIIHLYRIATTMSTKKPSKHLGVWSRVLDQDIFRPHVSLGLLFSRINFLIVIHGETVGVEFAEAMYGSCGVPTMHANLLFRKL